MKEHTHVINRAALLACALGVALLAPPAHRAARADAGVNGPVLAIVGFRGEGLPSPYFSLVAVGARGVTVLARQIPNTFVGLAPSPRGRYVAIAGGITGLWEADADGAHLHRAPSPPAADGHGVASVTAVAWSPDRYTLAYTLDGGRDGDGIYLARYDGTGQRLLMSAARLGAALGPHVRRLSFRRLSWSADGRMIAVTVVDAESTAATTAALLVDAAAGRVRGRIPDVIEAAYSPTAPALAYLAPAPIRVQGRPVVGFTLSVADATGQHPRALFSTAHFVSTGPVWSPDGAGLAYTWSPGTVAQPSYGSELEIHAIDVATAVVRTLATGPGPSLNGEDFLALAWLHTKE